MSTSARKRIIWAASLAAAALAARWMPRPADATGSAHTAVGYDADRGCLVVPSPAGRLLEVHGVGRLVAAEYLRASNPRVFFQECLRGAYPIVEVRRDGEEPEP